MSCKGTWSKIRQLPNSALLMTACKTASGVEIIPPHRVTRAGVNVPTHLEIRHEDMKTLTLSYLYPCMSSPFQAQYW